jgi:hypothetical protein
MTDVNDIMITRGSIVFTPLAALALLGVSACSQGRQHEPDAAQVSTTPEPSPATDAGAHADADAPTPAPAIIPPEHLVLAFRDGQATEMDDRQTAAAGLTVVDLRDTWAPRVLRGTAEQPNSYEKTYVDLANERGEPVDYADPRAADYYLEVYGISPSPSTIKRRLEAEKARPCFNDIDYAALAAFTGSLAYGAQSPSSLKAQSDGFRSVERRVKSLMKAQGVERPEEITGEQALMDQWNKLAPTRLAIRAAQQRLGCEGLFPGTKGHRIADVFDWATHIGLLNFERRHRFYGWGFLNEETAHAMSWNPEETALHTLERAITERVIDAAGIIEDGSTTRRGEVPTYRGQDGAEHPVRDLVTEFTTAAMRHLGLADATAAAAFLEAHDFATLRVALPLPELPEYYSAHMDLEAVIDRGDVWYDFPYDDAGNEIAQPVGLRPTLTLYVNYNGSKIPLARYGTTIGGWRSTVRDGVEYWAYKNSDVGARVWRHIVGAPSWIPPESTPLRDLVIKSRRSGGRRYEVNSPELGPGYASAYGLVMGINEQEIDRDGTKTYLDNGIRAHGSVNYQSIQKRHSHGCHRLHNHLALRLFAFILAHRTYTTDGEQVVSYRRAFDYEDQHLSIAIDTRGYQFELQPPVPVMVTRGRILGVRQTPFEDLIIKPAEAERLAREAAADAGVDDGGALAPATADGGPPK